MGPAVPNPPDPARSALSRPIVLVAIGLGLLVVLVIGSVLLAWTIMSPNSAVRAQFDSGFAKSFFPSMHDSCIKSASASLAEQGLDPKDGDAGRKIEAFCSCTVDETKARLSTTDLEALSLNSAAEPAVSTIKAAAQTCRGKAGL